MKKILKENKGFSLVELLVALLIMAVIAGTAITLFGGVLDTSKGRADAETAENIKRAILTYINASGDSNLSCLGVDEDDDDTPSKLVLDRLSTQFTIESGEDIDFPDAPAGAYPGFADDPTTDGKETVLSTVAAGDIDSTDLPGKYGPFLDITKDPSPTQNGMLGWVITVDPVTQAITVETVKDSEDKDECKVIIGDES